LQHDGTGGQTTLVDGFNVVQELKDKYPEAFEFLSKTQIPFHYKDDKTYFYRNRTIFDLDESGSYSSIIFWNFIVIIF
jgi:hypothetical protein